MLTIGKMETMISLNPLRRNSYPKNYNSTQKEPNLRLMLTTQPRKLRFQTTATNSSVGVINNSLTGKFY